MTVLVIEENNKAQTDHYDPLTITGDSQTMINVRECQIITQFYPKYFLEYVGS